jgi:hypothetical protein
VCDGVSPKPNRAWNTRGAVILKRKGAALTLALPSAPGLGFVEGVTLEGDGNDTYAVDGSVDGAHFFPIGSSSPPPRGGIQRWPFYFNDGASWSHLRIAPLAGDGFFSLAEIRPLLAAGALVDFGTPPARAVLRDGWSTDAQNGAEHWVTPLGPAAGVELSLIPSRAYDVSLRLRASDGHAETQHIAVEFDQHPVTELDLPPGVARGYSFRIPAALVQAKNALRFAFGPGGRAPGVQFRTLILRPVLDHQG